MRGKQEAVRLSPILDTKNLILRDAPQTVDHSLRQELLLERRVDIGDDPREALRRHAAEVWMRVAGLLGYPPDVEAQQAFAERVAARLGDSRAVPENLDAALPGNADVVSLGVRRRLAALSGRADALLDFIDGALADTLARLEREGAAPEQLADIVLLALPAALDMSIAIPGLPDFVAGLRAKLDEQEEARRDEGYYQTRLALGQLCGKSGNAEGRALAGYYYEELLQSGPRMIGDRATNIAANNLAGFIASRQRNVKTGDAPHRQVAFHLQFLATACNLAQPGIEIDGKAALAFGKSAKMPFADAELAGGAMLALLEMANVPSAWQVIVEAEGAGRSDFGEAGQLLLGVLAGLARMAFNAPEDHDEIAAAFFNSGISALRVARGKYPRSKDPDAASQKFIIVRIVLNGLGLWWALEKSRDIAQALDAFHGMDCAVNLFGALADTRGDAKRMVGLTDSVADLAGLLLGALRAVPQTVQMEAERLLGSLKQMEIEPGQDALRGPLPDKIAVTGAVAKLLRSVPELSRVVAAGLEPNTLALPLLTLVKAALGGEEFQAKQRVLIALLKRLVAVAKDTDACWHEAYGRFMSSNDGPVVQAAVMSAEEWRGVGARAKRPIDSLAHGLREAFVRRSDQKNIS